MPESKSISSSELFSIIRELFEHDQNARIVVTGTSMYPFLRENTDSVELKKTSFDMIKKGDIVLILRENKKEYILHRVLKKTVNSFFIIGDHQRWIEGPLKPEQLIASVVSVWRGDRHINCKSRMWRLLSTAWLSVIPFRGFFLRLFYFADKLL